MPTPETTTPIAICSFCTRSNTQVNRLVAGPGVYICDTCVALCNDVLTTTPLSDGPPVMPWESETRVEQILLNLKSIAAGSKQVEQNLTEWVRRARSLGATWARVGEALDMTRQSAWERFSGEE